MVDARDLAARAHPETGLFARLPLGAGAAPLARAALPAGELPGAREVASGGAAAQEEAPVPLHDGRADLDSHRAHDTIPA